MITHISVLTNATLIAFQSSWMETHFFGKLMWVKKYPDTPDSINYALLAARLLFIFFYEVGFELQNDSWQKKSHSIWDTQSTQAYRSIIILTT